MQGRLAGWELNASYIRVTSSDTCWTPPTSMNCDGGIGSRERRDFVDGMAAGEAEESFARSTRMLFAAAPSLLLAAFSSDCARDNFASTSSRSASRREARASVSTASGCSFTTNFLALRTASVQVIFPVSGARSCNAALARSTTVSMALFVAIEPLDTPEGASAKSDLIVLSLLWFAVDGWAAPSGLAFIRSCIPVVGSTSSCCKPSFASATDAQSFSMKASLSFSWACAASFPACSATSTRCAYSTCNRRSSACACAMLCWMARRFTSVQAAARVSGSFAANVSDGASVSTRSLITRLRKVVGRRSSPSCRSAVTVISAPWPRCVNCPGRTDTGMRTRFSA